MKRSYLPLILALFFVAAPVSNAAEECEDDTGMYSCSPVREQLEQG